MQFSPICCDSPGRHLKVEFEAVDLGRGRFDQTADTRRSNFVIRFSEPVFCQNRIENQKICFKIAKICEN